MYVGWPASQRLEDFGGYVRAAFGEIPYVVGSSLRKKRWRDVDVRLILSDERFDAEMGKTVHPLHRTAKSVALSVAFSALGREMTGLPIDFQIQRQTFANNDPSCVGPRSALGCLTVAERERMDRIEGNQHPDVDPRDFPATPGSTAGGS